MSKKSATSSDKQPSAPKKMAKATSKPIKKGPVSAAEKKVKKQAEKQVKKTALKPKSSVKSKAAPKKASVRPELSEAEIARRKRFEASKKYHEPTEAERAYGQGRLPIWEPGWLLIQGAGQNNLQSVDVPIPLSAMTAVTGVSGSGKSSLITEVLYAALARTLNRAQTQPGIYRRILGMERLNKTIAVDQRPIGQTPTSNPATYTGLFDLIRELYAKLPESKLRGYAARRFSFNVPGGRCEKCEGAGQLKIEMHFLADVWVPCDACGGQRYDPQTLEILYKDKSIADVLNMSCGEALKLFASIPAIHRILKTLCDVGLDYMALGQSAVTLSGGEAQRVKLAAELSRPDTGRTLYVLDEPTTGLHFDDLKKLLDVLHRLTDLGNTVVLIEHQLDVIKNADWVVDLGPEAGAEGGRVVFAGTPEELTEYSRQWLAGPESARAGLLRSYTGEALLPVMEAGPFVERKTFDAAAYQEELERAQTNDWEEEFNREVPMPWEADGRRWHTEERRSRSGALCRWDGRILAEVIDRIEESDVFADTDWKNRSIVEVRASKKSTGWFFHAITGEEWLLKMKFRVPKGSFKRDDLITQLDLRPLNEIDDIPLYGTQPRVHLESVGPWQEVELRVCFYREIDRPEFRAFLDEAIERFGAFAERHKSGAATDLTPWKTLGEKWHKTAGNCYGARSKPFWEIELLEKVFDTISLVEPNGRFVWTNKILVPFYRSGDVRRPWIQVNTKNCEAVGVQITVPKNAISLGQILSLGSDPEVDGSRPDNDTLCLRFRSKKEFSAEKFRALLTEALASAEADHAD